MFVLNKGLDPKDPKNTEDYVTAEAMMMQPGDLGYFTCKKDGGVIFFLLTKH